MGLWGTPPKEYNEKVKQKKAARKNKILNGDT